MGKDEPQPHAEDSVDEGSKDGITQRLHDCNKTNNEEKNDFEMKNRKEQSKLSSPVPSNEMTSSYSPPIFPLNSPVNTHANECAGKTDSNSRLFVESLEQPINFVKTKSMPTDSKLTADELDSPPLLIVTHDLEDSNKNDKMIDGPISATSGPRQSDVNDSKESFESVAKLTAPSNVDFDSNLTLRKPIPLVTSTSTPTNGSLHFSFKNLRHDHLSPKTASAFSHRRDLTQYLLSNNRDTDSSDTNSSKPSLLLAELDHTNPETSTMKSPTSISNVSYRSKDSIFRSPTPTHVNIVANKHSEDNKISSKDEKTCFDEIQVKKSLTWTASQEDSLYINDNSSYGSQNSKTKVSGDVKQLSHPPKTEQSAKVTGFGIATVPSRDNTQTTYFTIATLFSIFPVNDPKLYIHISVYSMLGTTVRIILARLFGQDCESTTHIPDFLSKTALCVTSTGKTNQHGGAIFIDLPANILGSYVMGLMTGLSRDWPAIPWLKTDHPLQSHTRLHTGIRVGFCGCLTTFASWTSQMISMMDGHGEVLGSQICPALFGFMIGLHCSIMSFVTGRHTAWWLNSRVNPHVVVEHNSNRASSNSRHIRSRNNKYTKTGRLDIEKGISLNQERKNPTPPNSNSVTYMTDGSDSNEARSNPPPIIVFPNLSFRRREQFSVVNCVLDSVNELLKMQNFPFIILGIIMTMFMISDFLFGISFYRSTWISLILSPPGVILRWKLSALNGTFFQNSSRYKWIPWGTLAANILGCVVSSICSGTLTGYYNEKNQDWLFFVLSGLRSGFAGSLSTVSTYVKEIVQIIEKSPGKIHAYLYAIGSIIVCATLSLCIYSPLVRSQT